MKSGNNKVFLHRETFKRDFKNTLPCCFCFLNSRYSSAKNVGLFVATDG